VVTVPRAQQGAFQALLAAHQCPQQLLGVVQAAPRLQLQLGSRLALDLEISALAAAHGGGIPRRLQGHALGQNG
jgi:hypothetical protein